MIWAVEGRKKRKCSFGFLEEEKNVSVTTFFGFLLITPRPGGVWNFGVIEINTEMCLEFWVHKVSCEDFLYHVYYRCAGSPDPPKTLKFHEFHSKGCTFWNSGHFWKIKIEVKFNHGDNYFCRGDFFENTAWWMKSGFYAFFWCVFLDLGPKSQNFQIIDKVITAEKKISVQKRLKQSFL